MNDEPKVTASVVQFRLNLEDGTEIHLVRSPEAAQLYELVARNREHLQPWMTWMERIADSSDITAWVRAAEREAHEHTAFKAGIWRSANLIGFIDLHDLDWNNRHARIGYWLDQAYTGQGIMTRCVQALVQYAFEALNLHRIEIHVATENYRSRRIPERLGFEQEGVLRHAQRLRGTYVDHALYALLREED